MRPASGLSSIGRETGVCWGLAFGWVTLVAGGFWLWERYDTTPGAVSETVVAVDETHSNCWRVTVFAHPRCPCTRATLRELAELLSAAPDLAARVMFVRPASAPGGWEKGESWDTATRIPGVDVACDTGGTEARRFGAETSGQVVLTDPTGRVAFRGGLTRARGRTGESAGRRAVLNWVMGRTGATTTLVFGCPLFAVDD